MGFLLNDAIIIAKARSCLQRHKNLYSLGKPKSFVLSKDMKFILSKPILQKLDINFEILDKKYYSRLLDYEDKKIISFNFFCKLLKFENNFSIDISKNEKPDFCLDITSQRESRRLFNKADLIYDTGSLGYTDNIKNSLNSLIRILKKNGIIVHSLPSNGYVTTGRVQINRFCLDSFYNQTKLQVLYVGYGFTQNFFTKIFFGKGGGRIVDIESEPSISRLKNSRCSIFYLVKKNACYSVKKKYFLKKCFAISIFFRKYFKGIFFFVKY
jgi:SAM-dependent methyltransferase